MTKFEKIAKRAELLGIAYQSIIERDKWDNQNEAWTYNAVVIEDRIEEHEFYMSVAKEIEKLL